MKGYKYYQLLDENYDNLVKDDENPANIPDGTHGQTAFRMAREWMKANKDKVCESCCQYHKPKTVVTIYQTSERLHSYDDQGRKYTIASQHEAQPH